jgi:hypothetical protein
MKTISDWCDYRSFDTVLKRRIKQHYQYMLNQTNGYGDFHLVEILPKHLRNEVVNKIWPKWINVLSVSLFLDPEVVGYDLVRELLGFLRPQQLLTGDVLCEQDDLLEDIYFVVTGIVEGVTESLRLPGRNSMLMTRDEKTGLLKDQLSSRSSVKDRNLVLKTRTEFEDR